MPQIAVDEEVESACEFSPLRGPLSGESRRSIAGIGSCDRGGRAAFAQDDWGEAELSGRVGTVSPDPRSGRQNV